MVHINSEFLPDKTEHEIYEQLYSQVFTKIFDKLSPFYQEINEIIRKK